MNTVASNTSVKLSEDEVRSLVDGIRNLPTPPMVFHHINRVVSDPKKSAGDVAAILAEDAALAAKVLRMSNSAYYALSNPVSSVRQAVIILGMRAVKSLVLSASFMEAFKADPIRRERQEALWRHSLATAVAARILAHSVGSGRAGCEPDEAFSAGLLHDVGKMIILCYMTKANRQIDKLRMEEEKSDLEIEIDVLGTNHCEIGAILIEKWNLAPSIAEAIRDHHSATAANPGIGGLIQLADALAHEAIDHSSMGLSSLVPSVDAGLWAWFGLDPNDLDDWAQKIRDDYSRSQTFLEMASI